MNGHASAPRPHDSQHDLPRLSRRERLYSSIASALVSTILLVSVVIGLTSIPSSNSRMAGAAPQAAPRV